MKKVALITGATRGIGRSTAIHLANNQYCVVVNGTNQHLINEVVQQIRAEGNRAVGYCTDIADVEAVSKMIEAVMVEFGQIDVFIHNAGNLRDEKCMRMSTEQWHDVINVHLHGAFYCISRVLPHLLERGGDILLMTSTAGLMGSKGQLNYSAAKAGILGMTWTLAEELKPLNIRVNAISPAALTDMTKPVIDFISKKYAERNEPFPEYWKVGTPEDIAHFISTLLAQQDANLTGEIFGVNGTTVTKWTRPQQSISASSPERFFAMYDEQKGSV
ncbi:SDR family NAD(P)-dependent oxidoreductase [Lysinibacillus sp. NPDC093712]|uniref:SDR family NAD(P)-dependent oxidoreductase n=1 Tax=Lysinibacillus sp. NPDC093712 TaxID=3390579 RepID=UPI003CFD4DB8